MHEAMGKQKDYILTVEPVQFPDADDVVAKVRKSRGVIDDVEPVVVATDEDGDCGVAGGGEIAKGIEYRVLGD